MVESWQRGRGIGPLSDLPMSPKVTIFEDKNWPSANKKRWGNGNPWLFWTMKLKPRIHLIRLIVVWLSFLMRKPPTKSDLHFQVLHLCPHKVWWHPNLWPKIIFIYSQKTFWSLIFVDDSGLDDGDDVIILDQMDFHSLKCDPSKSANHGYFSAAQKFAFLWHGVCLSFCQMSIN